MSQPLYQNVVEIGAGDSRVSEGLAMARRGEAAHVSLYEPNPILYSELAQAAADLPNVMVTDMAVTSRFEPLYLFGYASWLRGAPAFLPTSSEPDCEQHWAPLAVEVGCTKVDRMDGGTIDYLICTVGGGELDILQGLISRPKVIRTKHYLHNARQWEVYSRVDAWMRHNRYVGVVTQTNQHNTFYAMTWHLIR